MKYLGEENLLTISKNYNSLQPCNYHNIPLEMLFDLDICLIFDIDLDMDLLDSIYSEYSHCKLICLLFVSFLYLVDDLK